jgi:hypothetical protein
LGLERSRRCLLLYLFLKKERLSKTILYPSTILENRGIIYLVYLEQQTRFRSHSLSTPPVQQGEEQIHPSITQQQQQQSVAGWRARKSRSSWPSSSSWRSRARPVAPPPAGRGKARTLASTSAMTRRGQRAAPVGTATSTARGTARRRQR